MQISIPSGIDMAHLDLIVAYQIAEQPSEYRVMELHWACDRLWHGRANLDADSKANRSEATQRIAHELDARRAPMRDPGAPLLYPGPIPCI